MANITIKAPPKSKPGYFLRQKRMAGIQHRLRHDPSEEAVEAMINYLLTECEVSVPDGVNAEDVLWELSEEEFDAIIAQMRGDGVPPTNGV